MRPRTQASRKRRSASLRRGGRSRHLLGVAGVRLVLAAPLCQEYLPPDQAQVIEEENSIEVVDLVLNGSGSKSGRLLAVLGAVGILGFDHHPLGPGYVAVDLGNGEAAF